MQPESPPSPPWLSVLIPVYNVAPYLGACLDSILSQLAAGVEILLVDDGSTDDSLRIAEQLCAAHAPAVRLLRHERNRGLSAARNTLLEAAAGRYVWFVDSDDEMLPGAVATLQSVTAQHGPDMVLCSYRERGRTLRGFSGPAHALCRDREALIRGVFASKRMASWSRIVRRELWGADLRFPVGRCFEDIMTTPWLCLRARSFYYVEEPWIAYRVREGSILTAATRVSAQFDRGMNDDFAGALAGFRAAATTALPQMSAATQLAITDFCALTFADIGWRLLRARLRTDGWAGIRAELQRYRAIIERDAPASLARVANYPLRELKLRRWMKLRLMLRLTARG